MESTEQHRIQMKIDTQSRLTLNYAKEGKSLPTGLKDIIGKRKNKFVN